MASGFESQSRPRTRTIGRDSKRSVAVADHRPRTRGFASAAPQAEGNQPPKPKESTLQPRSPNRHRASTIGRGRGRDSKIGRGLESRHPTSDAVADHQPRTRTTALGFEREIQNRADGIGLRKSVSASDTNHRSRQQTISRSRGPSASGF